MDDDEPTTGTPGSPDSPGGRAPAMRASHEEREQVAEILRRSYEEGRLTLDEFDERVGVAYSARFRDELTGLTRDLVPHQPATPAAYGASREPSARTGAGRVTGAAGPGVSLAVMGGVNRVGEWAVPARHTAVAFMGGVEIDLCEATLESATTTITAVAWMGGVDITVPEDVRVEVSGLGIMGGFGESGPDDEHDRLPAPPPGAPVVRVQGVAFMGGVEVRRVRAPRDGCGRGDERGYDELT